jgi:hypothetical protein
MKQVLFLGLGASHSGWPQFKRHKGEVWTLNDWYAFKGPYQACPNPDRVYNIHADFLKKEKQIIERGKDKGRWKDWRKQYEKSGAEIVTGAKLGVVNERRFKKTAAKKILKDPLMWCATWSYMFADAIMEGYDVIRMERISLFSEGEYRRQAYGTFLCIEEARRRGIRVVWPWESTMRKNMDGPDWAGQLDVNKHYGEKSSAVVSIERTALQLRGK